MSIFLYTVLPKMYTDFFPKCTPVRPKKYTDLPEMYTMHYISKTILKRYKTSSIASRRKRVLRSPETPNHTQNERFDKDRWTFGETKNRGKMRFLAHRCTFREKIGVFFESPSKSIIDPSIDCDTVLRFRLFRPRPCRNKNVLPVHQQAHHLLWNRPSYTHNNRRMW